MEDNTLLARWLEGELSETERQQLESSPEYTTLLRIRENFTKLQPPRTDEERILREVLSHKKIRTRKVYPLYRKTWFQAAAVLLILLSVAVVFMLPKKFTTANAQTYALTLPDQSEVLLNAASEASYSRWNWSLNREVALEGEAYFKVSKGKTFTVKTKLGTVTVLGTQFNVKARENRFEVVCYEGKVRVRFNGNETVLLPHQKVIAVEGITAGKSETAVNEPEWTHQELAFSKEKLEAVLAALQRQYDVKITTTLQSKQVFSGALPGNNLDAALKMIATTYHLEIQRTGKTIILKPLDE